LAVTCAGRLYIHFQRLLLRNGILPGAKNFARCKIHFASTKSCAVLLAALVHGSRAVGTTARAKLCDVEHRAPPIFDRATTTLGIGQQSSDIYLRSVVVALLVYSKQAMITNRRITLVEIRFLCIFIPTSEQQRHAERSHTTDKQVINCA